MADKIPCDDYERTYMNGEHARLRSRTGRFRWLTALIPMLLAIAFYCANSDLASPGSNVLLLMLSLAYFLFGFIAVLTTNVTRVVITDTHLHVHQTFKSHEIALNSICSVALEYRGRWVRRFHHIECLIQQDSRYYALNIQPALRVNWRDSRGRVHRLLTAFDEAPQFFHDLDVRVLKIGGVRVAEDEDDATSIGHRDFGGDANAEAEPATRLADLKPARAGDSKDPNKL